MTEQPRDDTGQFTSGEVLTGREGIEADLGYKPMPEPEDRPEQESSIREEAERLAASRVPDPVVDLTYFKTDTGEPTDPTETVSLERAAKDLSAYHGQQDDERARSVSSDFAKEIDKMRADAIKDDPKLAEELAVEAAKAAKAEGAETAQEPKAVKTESVEADPYSDIEGLDEPTKQALRVPQIRQAVEQEFEKVEQAKTAYQSGLNNAHQFGQAAILALAPELAQVPVERWGEGINVLAQSDPVRAQQLGRMFQNVAALTERQQLVAHHEQAQRYQQFETLRQQYGQQSDKVLGLSNSEKAQMAEELVSYLVEHGVSREQLMQEARTNLLVHHPAFNALAKDALKYRAMQKATKAMPTKNLPPVTRPGTSVHRSSGDNSTKIAALERQLATASGNKAIKIGAELMRARRG
jgi:hypothetical protein